MMRAAMLERAEGERTGGSLNERLSEPELRSLVERFVRRRVPEVEVDDVVQTVLVHALASKSAPDEDEALRKWLVGITRHKVADFHRKGGRAKLVELTDQHVDPTEETHAARELVDWAEKQTSDSPDAKRTLDWMVREGDGEKLAHIAEEERLPPTQVRQRVSRMRRMMKQRWAAELAAVAAILILALVAWRLLRDPEPMAKPDVIPDVVPTPEPPKATPLERAELLRDEAEAACDRGAFEACLEKVNEAAGLDPDGDRGTRATELRRRAEEALNPPKVEPDPSVAPDPSEVPTTRLRPPSTPSEKDSGPPPNNTKQKPAPSPSPTPSPTTPPQTVPSPKKQAPSTPGPKTQSTPDKKKLIFPPSTKGSFNVPSGSGPSNSYNSSGP